MRKSKFPYDHTLEKYSFTMLVFKDMKQISEVPCAVINTFEHTKEYRVIFDVNEELHYDFCFNTDIGIMSMNGYVFKLNSYYNPIND